MKLIINPKSVYGQEKFYPGCEQSQMFAELLKQSVLTERDLRLIKLMGYTIEMQYKFTKEHPLI